MPLIKLEFDDAVVSDSEARTLSIAIREIVAKVTSIEDVFVYTNSARIKIKIAPIEIFVEMSVHKIVDADQLVLQIKESLAAWKKKEGFSHYINLTLIPMNWKVEIGI